MKLSANHAELVGLHFGDGSLIQRKGTNLLRFQLRGDATSDREHYEQFIIPLCNELIGLPILGRKLKTAFDRKLNSFGITLESSQIKPFFDELGIPTGVKKELIIPEWIKENEEYSKAFIRGLFDTDGGISHKRNNSAKGNLPVVENIKIASISRQLIGDVSLILSHFGVKHYLLRQKQKKGNCDAYYIGIYKPHVSEFMAIIGSRNPKHLTKHWVDQKYGFCPTHTTLAQRRLILKGLLDPFSLVNAEVGQRSTPLP